MELNNLKANNTEKKAQVYLFDWGDTLMVDFPDCAGKMSEWPKVEAMPDANIVLAALSKTTSIFIATSAADSTEKEIKLAFERVGLSEYITGYFCKENLGIEKGAAAFFPTILSKLNMPASQVTMVGDTYEKDIKPALEVGINAIWFTSKNKISTANEFKTITSLNELIIPITLIN